MSNTGTNRPTRAKMALVPLVSLGLLGVFLGLAAPANADTSRNGCTVNPLDPKDVRGDDVDFRITVDCNGQKTVEIRQRAYEDERGPRRNDDLLAKRVVTEEFGRHDDARTLHFYVDVRNHDRKGEEVYQLVSFRVQNHGGHWSDWTPWEKSAVVEVDHHGH